MSTPVPNIRIGAEEARAIAMDAYVYGFPIVDNYRIQHSYFIDRSGPEYRASFNHLFSNPRIATPDDRAVSTPEADVMTSCVGADLRTEPLVLSVPAMGKDRYHSLQFVDMYTHNFAYAGTRTTGNEAGRFLLAGPSWRGDVPAGVKAVLQSETEFAYIIFHTQVLGAADVENVRNVQAGYRAQTVSGFLNAAPPHIAPAPDFIRPMNFAVERRSLEFFNVLNFLLAYCPTHASEACLLDRFGKIGIGASRRFDAATLPKETRDAIEDGVADAWMAFEHHKRTQVDTGKLFRADAFGTRDMLRNNYLLRMSSAALGIYGPSREESLCPSFHTDSAQAQLHGSRQYTMRFAADKLPPVNGFWSVTMYELPSSLLYRNELDRYLIDAPMLPSLARDEDGGVTIDIQHERPDDGRRANWLPAPPGEFFVALRMYWPKAEALDGRWQSPALQRRTNTGVQ